MVDLDKLPEAHGNFVDPYGHWCRLGPWKHNRESVENGTITKGFFLSLSQRDELKADLREVATLIRALSDVIGFYGGGDANLRCASVLAKINAIIGEK